MNTDTFSMNFTVFDEEQYWQAILNRDRRFDGVFLCGVRSTGIYCRPSCPARKPRRDRVVFFTNGHAARQAGYRPCKRCQPDEQPFEVEITERICRYIQQNLDTPLTLGQLSAEFNLSAGHLQRVFKRVLGVSPRQYIEAERMKQVKERLKEGVPVNDALYGAGFGSSSRLYEKAPSQIGMTPQVYMRGGKGMQITYTLADYFLGRLLVAATEKGICAVYLGGPHEPLEKMLEQEFPAAVITRDDRGLSAWVTQIIGHLDGNPLRLDLPLDIQATAFQRRVWQVLQAIPLGETRSYSQVAEAIGNPRGVRAVARACATNPAPLVIPCHRVVGKDGSLTGYRYGVERKRLLLAKERQAAKK